MRPAVYEIHFDGTLSPEELAEFVGMTATDDGSRTVLRGVIRDQPALVGIVARVEARGCTVRVVRALAPPRDEGRGRSR